MKSYILVPEYPEQEYMIVLVPEYPEQEQSYILVPDILIQIKIKQDNREIWDVP
jgi:hypothetical protein